MSTDEKIIQAFLNGNVKGITDPYTKPDHLQTQISHIFLFRETAYKLYRKDNDNFNQFITDLRSDKSRKIFYRQDFFWNNYFNKYVYQELLGIDIKNDNVVLKSDSQNCYDLIIKMKRIDANHNLTELLRHGTLKEKDFRIIGYEMTKAISEFTLLPKTRRNYYYIIKVLLDDLEKFSWMASPFITRKSINRVIKVLRKYAEEYKEEFSNLSEKDLVLTIDNHSDNIYYNDGKVSFLDVYLPKDNWQIVEPRYSICRLSADVRVLGGEKFADALTQGYQDFYGGHNLNKSIQLFYEIYSALIKDTYLYLIYKESGKRKDEADRYWQFIESGLNKISY